MAGTNYNALLLANVKAVFTNDDGFLIRAECNGNPNVVATQSNIFVPGCLMLRSDFNLGVNLYQNTGTLSSPTWTSISGGGGSTPVTSLTGTPTEIVYIDNTGNGIGDALATRDSVTNETYIGYRTDSSRFTNALKLGNFLGSFIPDGVGFERHDGSLDNYTFWSAIDGTVIGGSINTLVGGYVDFTNNIYSTTTFNNSNLELDYANANTNEEFRVGGGLGGGDIGYYGITNTGSINFNGSRIQSRFNDSNVNVITKVILDNTGVELNYQDGIGSNHFYVTNDTITSSTLYDTRDDSGSVTPINFLYTDSSGKFLSSPLSVITPNFHFYKENYGAFGVDAVVTGTNSVSIGNHSQNYADSAVAILGVVNSGATNSVAIAGGVGSGATNSVAIMGTVSAPNTISVGGTSSAQNAASFGGSGAFATGISSLAFATNGYSIASGVQSIVLGNSVTSYSYGEVVTGKGNTVYIPVNDSVWDNADRLFVVGASNTDPGSGTNHDAITVQKSGKVGLAYDNFETNTSSAKVQVNGYIAQSLALINTDVSLTSSTIANINHILDTSNIDITLPDPASITTTTINGVLVTPQFIFKCTQGSSFTVRILPFSSETIDGNPSFTFTNMSQLPSIVLYTEGTNWFIAADYK